MTTIAMHPRYKVKLAQTTAEVEAAKRLRYDVFVAELGGNGADVDHIARLEQDRFDAHCDHLLLVDAQSDTVIGAYRLMQNVQAQRAGGFYSEAEYNIDPLKQAGRPLLELGRSCLHPDHRGGTAMHQLWTGLVTYVAEHKIEILFGVASFRGTNPHALAQPLSLLHHAHLAPASLRARAMDTHFQSMDLIDPDTLNRRSAMVQIPSLIKAYLRMGGVVGEGAFVDHAFNTTDVFLMLDTAKIPKSQIRKYTGLPT